MAAVELEKANEKKGGTKEKEFDTMAEFVKLTSSRSGGVYMPPARLRALQAAAAHDRSNAEHQRLAWDALRKSITSIVNRVNVGNIKHSLNTSCPSPSPKISSKSVGLLRAAL
jgi:pre-mRNA-splicing factor CWC22